MPADLNFLLSVVIPTFNEEDCLRECLNRLHAAMSNLGCNYELLFVNDGSTDSSLSILKEEKQQNTTIRIIDLSRNFGHQMAITAGLDHARGDVVVIIDADLQDPPELIPELIAKWREGHDVVHARRRRRLGETVFKKWTASIFYRILQAISETVLPPDTGDFKLMTRRVLDNLRRLRERHRYIRGMVSWLGYKQGFVDYERKERYAGSPKYTFFQMLRLSLAGVTSFSVLPLRLASYSGFLVAAAALLYIFWALYLKFILQVAIPGWTSVIVAVLLVGGIQLICLGIIGEYLGLLYDEVKKRPLYVVTEVTE